MASNSHRPPRCPRCEYDLTGTLSAGLDRCPECGAGFLWAEVFGPTRPKLSARGFWTAAAGVAVLPAFVMAGVSAYHRIPLQPEQFFAYGGNLPELLVAGAAAHRLGRREDWFLWAVPGGMVLSVLAIVLAGILLHAVSAM